MNFLYILYILEGDQVYQFAFETEKECYNKVLEKKQNRYKIYREDKAKPVNFSPALEWDYEKNDVKLNIQKTKEIKISHFRLLREEVFKNLDILFMKAVESGNQTKIAEIAEIKQQLRDITTLDLPNTEEELLNYMPECLFRGILLK